MFLLPGDSMLDLGPGLTLSRPHEHAGELWNWCFFELLPTETAASNCVAFRRLHLLSACRRVAKRTSAFDVIAAGVYPASGLILHGSLATSVA